MHSILYANRSICEARFVALCSAFWEEYVIARMMPSTARSASRTSVLRIKYLNRPALIAALSDVDVAELKTRRRKKELRHSKRAMRMEYPICRWLIND